MLCEEVGFVCLNAGDLEPSSLRPEHPGEVDERKWWKKNFDDKCRYFAI